MYWKTRIQIKKKNPFKDLSSNDTILINFYPKRSLMTQNLIYIYVYHLSCHETWIIYESFTTTNNQFLSFGFK